MSALPLFACAVCMRACRFKGIGTCGQLQQNLGAIEQGVTYHLQAWVWIPAGAPCATDFGSLNCPYTKYLADSTADGVSANADSHATPPLALLARHLAADDVCDASAVDDHLTEARLDVVVRATIHPCQNSFVVHVCLDRLREC